MEQRLSVPTVGGLPLPGTSYEWSKWKVEASYGPCLATTMRSSPWRFARTEKLSRRVARTPTSGCGILKLEKELPSCMVTRIMSMPWLSVRTVKRSPPGRETASCFYGICPLPSLVIDPLQKQKEVRPSAPTDV